MSSNFYTNVVRKGDNILVRGYENGQPYQKKVKFEPSIFFKHNSETDIKAPNGDYLKERKYESIFEANQSLKSIKGVHGMDAYGTDDWVRQYIRTAYPELKPDNSNIKTWYWDIETRVDGLKLMPHEPISIRLDGEIIETTVGEIFNYHSIPEIFCPIADDYVTIAKHSESAKGFPDPNIADRELMMVTFYDQSSDKIYIMSRKKIRESSKTFTEFGNKVDFKHFESERTMLKEILMFFKTHRMDFLLGWNSNFDLGFTYNRIKNVLGENLAEHMSPWGYMSVREKRLDNGEVVTYYSIPGIASMDYLEMYQKFNPGSKESFKLDFIAELEVGERKVDLPGETFYESYSGDYDVDELPDQTDPHYSIYEKVFRRTKMKRGGDKASVEFNSLSAEIEQDHIDLFTYYNVIDTILVKKIDDKQKLVDLCCMIAYGARVNFDQTLSSMMTWESIIYNYFVDNKIMPPVSPKRSSPRPFPGAYVMKSIAAKYGWILSVDATALYPSIMMQNNISPEKKVCMLDGVSVESLLAGSIPEFDRDKYFLWPNGLLTEKGEYGYIPYLVKQKFDERKEYKKHMLNCETEAQKIRDSVKDFLMQDIVSRLSFLEREAKEFDVKQKAVKVLANSLYGITGNSYFTGYDPDLSEAITLMGQFSLKLLKKTVDTFLNKAMGTTNFEYIIAQDTDSAYISVQNVVDKFCVGKNQQETVDFLVKFVEDVLQPVINKAMSSSMSKLGVDDCKLFYKLECIGPSAIWTAPKKYAFDILYSEGVRYAEPKMKVMGIEIVRASTPHVVRDHLKKCVKTMLSGTEYDLQGYIIEVRKSFFDLNYTDISFPRGVNGLQKYSDSASIYQKGNGIATPIAVRAALLYNYHLRKMGLGSKYPEIGEGDKVKFTYLKKPNPFHENVIAFPSKLPKEFALEKYIDYNEQFAKSFLAPLDKLLDAVKWKAEKQNDAFDECW